ncbi:MAG: hypothetical protein RIT45_1445 [Pseudomonadota bacterium]|jgi:hypothetical protein
MHRETTLRKRPSSPIVAALMLAFLAGLLLPAVASSAPRKKGPRTLSFEEDNVDATYLRPEGSSIQGINKKKRQSLIRVRTDFFAEIVRSAQDL